MIDLYFWPTPNGHKITLFLEEAMLPYRLVPVDIDKGEQFAPTFLNLNPNNKIPVIVDHEASTRANPHIVFESGAILVYLAEKTGRFLSADPLSRYQTLQWLFWQVGGLGPMAGQAHHFRHYALERVPYAIERYTNEVARLYSVLERALMGHEFIAGEFSITDMAIYPWIYRHAKQGQDLAEFPRLASWFNSIKARPATKRAYEKGEQIVSS
jgi:GST-like protein